MKISEAITKIDALKFNTYTQSEKIAWLSTIDGMIKREIIDTHEGADKVQAVYDYIKKTEDDHKEAVAEYMRVNEVTREEAEANIPHVEMSYKDAKAYIEQTRQDIMFKGYDDSTSLDTVLIAPAPYDDLYIKWLEAQIDYTNGEYGKYNNSKLAFNTAYTAYESWYNRNHMPLGKRFKCF